MKGEFDELRPGQAAIGRSLLFLGAIVIGSALIGGLSAGLLDHGPRPIATGEITNPLTLWNKPIASTSNEGFTTEAGSRVAIFENYLVVTTPRGTRIVVPGGHVGPIHLKP